MSGRHRITIIIIILLGAWLRFDALTAETRFHPDEALFATFARDAAVHGAWMLPGALDKPPLSLYASALSMQFFGVTVNAKNVLDLDWRVGEIAARLPNVFAGIITIALTYTLGCAWFGVVPGLIAALLTALSPFLVGYSATAFTDPLMLALMLAALVMAARGRPAWSGLWLALAFATKQQAMFYLPLVVIILGYQGSPHPPAPSPSWRRGAKSKSGFEVPRPEGEGFRVRASWSLLRFALAFALILTLLLAWDAARPETSIFALAAVNNNPERFLIRADELLPRLETWLGYAGTIFGSPWLTITFIFLTALCLMPHVQMWRRGAMYCAPTDGKKRWARLLFLYIVGYFALHWLTAFNTYDRYLLPLVPLLALVIGNTFCLSLSATEKEAGGEVKVKFTFVTVFALIMLVSQTSFPSDNRARNREIVALADFLNAQPLGAIIYDHWLGWEMGYYIGAWSDKRRVYYPDAVTLAHDALNNPDPAPRWWIAPVSVESAFAVWLDALNERGFTTTLVYRSPAYVAYKVIPPWADYP